MLILKLLIKFQGSRSTSVSLSQNMATPYLSSELSSLFFFSELFTTSIHCTFHTDPESESVLTSPLVPSFRSHSVVSSLTEKEPIWTSWKTNLDKINSLLKSLLMEVKEESEKDGLKLSLQKTKIMASGSIISWQIDGETVETMADFIFWGSKITADGDCSYEIKRCLALGRKVMTNLDSILKSRDITMPPKVCLVKAMVFPVIM